VLCNLTLLVVVTSWLSANVVHADQGRVVRSGDERLKGIEAVDVVIDPVPPDSVRCGITRDALQQITVDTLNSAGLKATLSEKSSSWFYTVYATASTVRSSGLCATSIVTELTAQVAGIPEAERNAQPGQMGSLLVGPLTLIRHNGIVSSRASVHATHVRSVLSDHLSGIAQRVTAANK
jgi:hypothetical protein